MLTQLRVELLRRAHADQQARARWQSGETDWHDVAIIDADNTRWLAALIAEHGWPGRSLAGHDGAHAAWLLAQHSDLTHQQGWLGLLRQAVEHDEAEAADLAYLHDRVHIRQGKPQRYATQWRGLEPDTTRLFPLDDPSQVNTVRAAVGLAPIDSDQLAHALQIDDLHRPRDP